MTVPIEDPSRVWTPQPLPEDDVLAHDPTPEDVASVEADLVGVPEGPAAEGAPLVPADAEGIDADPDADPGADPDAGTDLDTGTEGTAAVPTGADAEGAPEVRSPVDVALAAAARQPRSGEDQSRDEQRALSGAIVGIVVVMFFVFTPVQVLVGNVLVWGLLFTVGGTLTIAGGIPTGRSVLRRGTAPSGPLLCFVAGVLILVGCAIATVVGAQAIT